jgi:hypothetical protein
MGIEDSWPSLLADLEVIAAGIEERLLQRRSQRAGSPTATA